MKNIDIESLAEISLDDLEKTLAALVDHKRYNLIDFWEPYPKQREFLDAGARLNERLLIAGNQVGKSDTGAFETAVHLTGLYPEWWKGRRFDRPVKAWAASESTTVVREVAQTKLCGLAGSVEDFGTGFIPKRCFAGKPTMARGAVADSYDTIKVYHHNKDGIQDGISVLSFKSYEQGRTKFQGSTLDFIWWDEEPPEDIYTEGNARWTATGGMSFITFTALKGQTTIVLKFLNEPSLKRDMVRMGVKDAAHMTPERIADAMAKYPVHEHAARINGEILLGEGRIFTTPEEHILFPIAQPIPPHWALLWGIDFGISHPFAAVLSAWDRDTDTIYIIQTYRAANELPLIHSEAIRRVAANVPVAWPHDGHAREKGTGENLAKVYKALDLKMLPTHAQYPEGGYSTEAAVLEMQQRLADGRLKVREDLGDWFDEYRMYHREKGLIVKIRDDLMSATQKIMMAKRHAKVVPLGWTARPAKRSSGERPARTPPINPWTGREIRQTA